MNVWDGWQGRMCRGSCRMTIASLQRSRYVQPEWPTRQPDKVRSSAWRVNHAWIHLLSTPLRTHTPHLPIPLSPHLPLSPSPSLSLFLPLSPSPSLRSKQVEGTCFSRCRTNPEQISLARPWLEPFTVQTFFLLFKLFRSRRLKLPECTCSIRTETSHRKVSAPGNHTLDYDPFIQSQLASRNQLEGPTWCEFAHATFEISNKRNPRSPLCQPETQTPKP